MNVGQSVAENADIPITAIGFDGIVPYLRYDVSIDIRIVAGRAIDALILVAANTVIIIVTRAAIDTVVATHTFAPHHRKEDGVGTTGMPAVRPAISPADRRVYSARLHHATITPIGAAVPEGDGCIVELVGDCPVTRRLDRPSPIAEGAVANPNIRVATGDFDAVILPTGKIDVLNKHIVGVDHQAPGGTAGN